MDEDRDDAFERRVQERADKLWREAGCPPGEGARDEYLDKARELVAIETDPHATTKPVKDRSDPDAEPLIAVQNQGEFPTLTDQGEETANPLPPGEQRKATR